jgi:hypothetical protein
LIFYFLARWRLPLFSSEVFYFEPFAFWGCLFFYRWSFVLGPLRFVVASFFIGGICFGPLAFWGCLFFHRRSFILVPLHFGVAFFYQRSFILSQRTKVAIMRLRLRLWLTWCNSLFVEYGASVASNFDDDDQCFGEMKLILLL